MVGSSADALFGRLSRAADAADCIAAPSPAI